ncbi:MAG: replication-associated recombination protein A [Clostridia bacterium]|nr:replication-associated recombination protein A [Clostridia bacterium]
MDLFDLQPIDNSVRPLAERMRPRTLDEFIGQAHLVGQNSIVSRAIKADRVGSCILYGPPGVGKTTLASIIASATKSKFVKLNAVSSGVADAKRVIDDARENMRMYGIRTYLLLDECHRWNKAQSDSVLAAIEDGSIIFIGSTTENPYVSMTKAIVSRCRIFEFKKLTDDDIIFGLKQAVLDRERGLGDLNVIVTDDAYLHLAWASAGDMRTALNALELAVLTTSTSSDGYIHITKSEAEQSIQKKAMSIDESMYYDMLSAFCKSLRGSDPDAALYWSNRLIEAGCDPMLILRRLIVHSAEDVGMADPHALQIAVSAMTAYEHIGLPEGRIPMAEAIIYVAEAPKSNSVVNALYSSLEAVREVKDDNVPMYLRDANYKGEVIQGYKYPHSFGGYVEQQYLPDSIKDREFYIPSNNGNEKGLIKRKKKLTD